MQGIEEEGEWGSIVGFRANDLVIGQTCKASRTTTFHAVGSTPSSFLFHYVYFEKKQH